MSTWFMDDPYRPSKSMDMPVFMTINQRGRSRSYVNIPKEDSTDEVFIQPQVEVLSEVVPIRTTPGRSRPLSRNESARYSTRT